MSGKRTFGRSPRPGAIEPGPAEWAPATGDLTTDDLTTGDLTTGDPAALAAHAVHALSEQDPQLHRLLAEDLDTQSGSLALLASASFAPPSVLACTGSALSNVVAKGYPGRRFQAGCRVLDEIEQLAVRRATKAFGARYANVQPHSGSSANLCVYFGLLEPGDTIMGLDLDSGGHISHGSAVSVTGKYFNAVGYGLDGTGRIDYKRVRQLAQRHRPKVIACGASAYPRILDFARFREIADEIGAYLLADISHVAGLVVAGEHPSPIDHAHITTAGTDTQLCGPPGGIILLGKDAETPGPDGRSLRRVMQRAVFPVSQCTPNPSAIAGKARALGYVATPEFRRLARLITANARALATELLGHGHQVLTYGTDNHLVLLDVMAAGMTGAVAEHALESCGILVNKHRMPFDAKPPQVGSGLRLGTNTLAARGLSPADMPRCAALLDTVLRATSPRSDTEYTLPDAVRLRVRMAVRDLCQTYPSYPAPSYPGTDIRPEHPGEPAEVPA